MSKFKTVYFASIAHDLRTPINTVLNINSQLELDLKQKKMVEISTSSCRFLLATIDDIFDMSKLELD